MGELLPIPIDETCINEGRNLLSGWLIGIIRPMGLPCSVITIVSPLFTRRMYALSFAFRSRIPVSIAIIHLPVCDYIIKKKVIRVYCINHDWISHHIAYTAKITSMVPGSSAAEWTLWYLGSRSQVYSSR